jgi:hypothetical protein
MTIGVAIHLLGVLRLVDDELVEDLELDPEPSESEEEDEPWTVS